MVLDGKWALVTGAAKGIGRGIALELAQAGCNIIVNDYSDRAGAEWGVEREEAGGGLAEGEAGCGVGPVPGPG